MAESTPQEMVFIREHTARATSWWQNQLPRGWYSLESTQQELHLGGRNQTPQEIVLFIRESLGPDTNLRYISAKVAQNWSTPQEMVFIREHTARATSWWQNQLPRGWHSLETRNSNEEYLLVAQSTPQEMAFIREHTARATSWWQNQLPGDGIH